MQHSIALRRLGYRLASLVLGAVWRLFAVRPDGVKCMIVDGESLLLVRHNYGPRGWDLPGGAGHRREPPASTATREMAEELGLRLDGWRELGELRSLRGSHRVRILGTEVHEPSLTLDPVELADAAWFHRAALPRPMAPLLAPILAGGAAAAFLAGADRNRADG